MATRASIALLDAGSQSESLTSVYCHYDGYLEHVGKILSTYYRSPWKTKLLMNGGNISTLGMKLDTAGEHSFDKPAPRTTVFYRRDRGVEKPWHEMAIEYNSVANWIEDTQESAIDYYYLGVPVKRDRQRRNGTYVQNFRIEWLYTPASHLHFHYVTAALDAGELVQERNLMP